MIPVTRLNGKEFLLNPELIETLESTPDTVVTLRGGVRYVVQESPDDVSERILADRRKWLAPAAVARAAEAVG